MLAQGTFHDTSLEGLATRAGVSRATVYRAFGDKQAVVEALTWHELAKAELGRIDAAHELPDPLRAVHEVLRENCRMFSALGDGLPLVLDLARRDPDVAAIVDATYNGRRHRSMEHAAARLLDAGLAKSGWSADAIADSLVALTSFEVFETLTAWRGHTPASAAEHLVMLTTAFLAEGPDEDRTA
jgi:AcrR family transcriptional regulator